MLIYLNIFKSLKENNLLESNICDECIKVITNYFDETNMIPTEAISKTLYDIKNKSTDSSIGAKPIESNYNIKTDPFGEGGGTHINEATKNDYFNMDKKKSNKKGFIESLSLIETVFNGNFKHFHMVEDQKDIKFFEDNFNCIKYYILNKISDPKERKEKEKDINKKKFELKTPLGLYRDTYNDLNSYLENYNLENIKLEDLYHNILCLIYYFKIPIIDEKWIENLKPTDKDNDKIKSKEKTQKSEKIKDKKKEKDKNAEEKTYNNKEENLNELKLNTIPDIIAMLTDLFWNIKNVLFKQSNIQQ